VQLPAVQLDGGGAAGKAPAMGGDEGGAGAGAAGAGEAGAALPDLEADAARRHDLGESHIGALGKQRVVLDEGPDARDRRGLGVAHVLAVARTPD